ncbi:MAG: hypothetical protein EP347_05570 [Alphaproteobacteria bacterium]|nr:MAG: hypothetical protein EP347_05570 [Alphaproteobacteria bacterium]
MDNEMMKWREILPADPMKMNWQDWQSLLNRLSPLQLQHYWPDVRRDLIPDYTRARVTGQDQTDPYAGLSNPYRPASHRLPDPGARYRRYENKFTLGYQAPDVGGLPASGSSSVTGVPTGPATMMKSIPNSSGTDDGKHKERLTGDPDFDRETMSEGERAWHQLKAISVAGRLAGYPHAADNLDHFLGNTGTTSPWMKNGYCPKSLFKGRLIRTLSSSAARWIQPLQSTEMEPVLLFPEVC